MIELFVSLPALYLTLKKNFLLVFFLFCISIFCQLSKEFQFYLISLDLNIQTSKTWENILVNFLTVAFHFSTHQSESDCLIFIPSGMYLGPDMINLWPTIDNNYELFCVFCNQSVTAGKYQCQKEKSIFHEINW